MYFSGTKLLKFKHALPSLYPWHGQSDNNKYKVYRDYYHWLGL